MRKKKKKKKKARKPTRPEPGKIYLQTLPPHATDKSRMVDLVECNIHIEFIRSHLEVFGVSRKRGHKHTRASNVTVLFLESAAATWEACKFIAKIRDKYNIQPQELACADSERLGTLLSSCRQDDKPPLSGPLRLFHTIRNKASSHIAAELANYALNCRFVDLQKEPLWLSLHGSSMDTTSPFALSSLIFYCFQDCKSTDEANLAVAKAIETQRDVVRVLLAVQLYLGKPLKTFFRAEAGTFTT